MNFFDLKNSRTVHGWIHGMGDVCFESDQVPKLRRHTTCQTKNFT